MYSHCTLPRSNSFFSEYRPSPERKVASSLPTIHFQGQTLSFREHIYTSIHTLGGGNSKIFYFHPENWGNDSHFDEHIFQMGWFNH